MNIEPENVEPQHDDIVDSVADEAPAVSPDADANEEPAPVPVPAVKAKSTANAVVGKGDTDDVFLSRCVFKSRVTRKSLTVHHLQRRLVELGYAEAHTDKDGWYGDHTLLAVKSFQTDHKLNATGIVDADTLVAVFDGDHNVTVVVDA